ncbi:MAG: YkvA family protein [Cyanobacteria bacterium P01_H01_bin.15]
MALPASRLYDWYRGLIRNPKYRWWIVLGTLAYLVSPLDISPDLIPIVGQIDDIAVLALLLTEVSTLTLDAFRERSQTPKDDSSEATGDTVDVEAQPLD